MGPQAHDAQRDALAELANPQVETARRSLGRLSGSTLSALAVSRSRYAEEVRSVVRTKDLPELVLDARDGDPGAFDEIVRRTYADTFSLAHRLTGNAEDAGDVAQETYIRAFRYLQRFRGDAQFSTWLYRITTNCASTHLGRMRRHRHDELRADSPVADDNPEFDPALRADASAMRDEVQKALRRLPERLRAVVVLRDVHDLSHNAIATELGITETAAKVRLHRARVRLRELVLDRLTDADGTDAGRE